MCTTGNVYRECVQGMCTWNVYMECVLGTHVYVNSKFCNELI